MRSKKSSAAPHWSRGLSQSRTQPGAEGRQYDAREKARSGGKLIVNPTPWLAGNRPTGQELRRAIDVGNLAEFIFRTMTEIRL